MATVAEIESFISLLAIGCEDPEVYEQLEKILSLPNDRRKSFLQLLLSDMKMKQAPNDFVAAMACLLDDAVAEKAYEVISKCHRGEQL